MTKKIFEKIINGYIGKLPLDEQEKLLLKMKNVWIPSILNKKLEKYTKCNSCKKYYLTSRFKKVFEKNVRIEKIFTDAGYGDDDVFGQVEYLDYYTVCPVCGFKKLYKSEYLRTLGKN